MTGADEHGAATGAPDEDGDVRPALVAFVALALGLVVLAVIGLRAERLDEEPGLAIVGDSITLVTSPFLDDELGPDHEVDVRAALGVRVDAMTDEAAELAAASPEQAVVALGTNDVLQGTSLTDAATGIEGMVETFRAAGAECVHVVDVSPRMRTNAGEWTGERAEELNARTSALADAADDVVIVRWSEAVVAAEDRGEVVTPDTVHPDGAGLRLFATLIAESVEQGCSAEE